MSRPIAPSLAVLLGLVASLACSDRTQLHSDVGQQIALQLCSIQTECGCAEEHLIPDCEAWVEHEIAETERKAIAHGLELDEDCLHLLLDGIDALATCGVHSPWGWELRCPVYGRNAAAGETCEMFDYLPLMTDCLPGLRCVEGVCRDPDHPILGEGEICSDTQSSIPTGWLGRCAEGLMCDSRNTRTCVPQSPPSPRIPDGQTCTVAFECEEGSYCRPPEGEYDVSEEVPGICREFTPDGEPCMVLYECSGRCVDGYCEISPPFLCELLEEWVAAREFY
ncbi:hypothetical protein [Paraliomyxa miuraensis]|uniref:hypothetical protein n=1 Tax=Paraliomyxa miuraensis TaxID=376150 RepID=UPI00225805D1|nr:hypothetical protein [Paraliomyxa miuraensis]MCX4240860.1 hypothetical protein [Paraliomyxa miuraensis]